MKGDVVKGFYLLAFIALFHVLLGLLAVYQGGFFAFGATSPERYTLYLLGGPEYRISFSGNANDFINDVCIQTCPSCDLLCYTPQSLIVKCHDSCSLLTKGDTLICRQGDRLPFALKGGFTFKDAVFTCDRSRCGFEVGNDKGSYLSYLPDEVFKLNLGSDDYNDDSMLSVS